MASAKNSLGKMITVESMPPWFVVLNGAAVAIAGVLVTKTLSKALLNEVTIDYHELTADNPSEAPNPE